MKGIILDIGGGGDGIISQLNGDKVISIDPSKEELEESPGNSIKIVMNAEDLKFLDKTFDTVTSFFTLMYIDKSKHEKVLSEMHRVLKDDGELLIWDSNIPDKGCNGKDIFIIPLKIKMKVNYTIETGYGVSWNKTQSLHYYLAICKMVGFKVLECTDSKESFFIHLAKIAH